jgi:transcriptional regulator with XRE-family HTH domain
MLGLDNNRDILNLAHLVKKLRKRKGFSKKKLAQISGLSNNTIARIENGEIVQPDIDTLRILAIHLDYSESKLINLVNSNSIHRVSMTKAMTKAKLMFLQQPVRKIKRYSSVITPLQEIEIEQVQEEEQLQTQAFTSLPVNNDSPHTETERKIAIKGMRLITLRLERNTTQKELADSLGLDKTLISQYEGEIVKPDYNTVLRIADFFGVAAAYLTGESVVEISIEDAPKETYKEEIIVESIKTNALRQEYLTIAEEIQDAGIEIEDVRAFIDMLKKYKRS